MKAFIVFLRIIQWLLYLPAHLIVVGSAMALAPVAIKYFSTDDKLYLKRPFKWMMTVDNTLAGDSGWQNEHMPVKGDPLADKNRIGWMRRNGGNRANYFWLGCASDDLFNSKFLFRQNEWTFARNDGYWMLKGYVNLGLRYLNIFWGWSLFGKQAGRCKVTYTVRFKKTKS